MIQIYPSLITENNSLNKINQEIFFTLYLYQSASYNFY